jgi:hypothetical protein
MDVLRFLIAGFILLNTLLAAISAIRVVALKVRLDAGRPDPAEAVIAGMSWPVLSLWIGSMALLAASAVLLIQGSALALATFFAALVLDGTVFWTAQRSVRGESPATRERLTGYLLFGLPFAGGATSSKGASS